MRGATRQHVNQFNRDRHFNPRSPCGERRKTVGNSYHYQNFNPRSPCGERLGVVGVFSSLSIFQSTLPMRGATLVNALRFLKPEISIHAPHAGSDGIFRPVKDIKWDFNPRSPCGERLESCDPGGGVHGNFNPRSPCGERHVILAPWDLLPPFQSTLPMRGATWHHWSGDHHLDISIHAPHAGSDKNSPPWPIRSRYFNPRSPCGERQGAALCFSPLGRFQSTLPMRGATKIQPRLDHGPLISIHAPHAGSDRG